MNATVSAQITDHLTEFLQQQKEAGKNAAEAAQAVKQDYLQSALGQATLAALAVAQPDLTYAVRSSAMGASMFKVYQPQGLTPLSLAQSLKAVYGNANDVALGVAYGYPELTATQVGKVLLDPSIYPELSEADMKTALIYAGFSEADADTAVAALYNTKSTFTVQSVPQWQNSGVTVEAGEIVQVTYTGGYWTANPATGMVTAAGNSRYRAKAGYTLPGAYEGLLCGRVDGHVFAVGTGTTVPPGLFGALEFCINDDLRGQYGNGFTDNRGAVTVEISEKKG